MRKLNVCALAAGSVAVGLCSSATALAQGVPAARNDVFFGLSRATASESLFQIRGFPTGADTGSRWDLPFVQSVQLDNTDGFRHAHFGNLLGASFGTTAGGGSIVLLQSNSTTNPGTGTTLFAFDAADPLRSRLGGLSVSPANNRVAFTGSDLGRVYVMDYTPPAVPGSGTGATLANIRSTDTPSLGTGSTIATAWLDNDNVLALDRDGELTRTTVNNGTLSSTVVKTLTFGNTSGNPFTQVVYEPTISPYVYALQGTFDTALQATVNELFVLDPANNFDQVGPIINYSTSIQTLREASFDSRGNLFVGQFGSGTITPAIDYVPNAWNVGSLADNNSVDYYTVGGSITASFSGSDVASTMLDFKTPNITVNLRDRQHAQRYFGASPLAEIRQKVQAGYNGGSWNGVGILSSNAAAQPGYAVGYGDADDLGLVGQTFGGETVEASSVLFRLTRYGDANLDGTVNLGDFNRLAANFGATNSFWHRGDFNYDGNVNLSDFNLLAANFGLSAAGPEVTPEDWARLGAAVPEPTSVALLVAGAVALLPRRRRA